MHRTLFFTLFTFISLQSFAQDNVCFSQAYKTENQGKYKIEINELKELVHIMIAITQSGKENDDMIEQRGSYYQDILTHFAPYENEPIIKTFDSLMVASPYNYIFLTGNAMSYQFDTGNKLIKSDVFIFPAQGVADMVISENPISTYRQEIEDFARVSQFREFYAAHQTYYDQIISDYQTNANLGKQWTWLEENFKTKKNSYVIFCSPLINGLNYTGQFSNNDFSLIYLNLPPVAPHPDLSPLAQKIINTRVMFTEIDHNYVHQPTEDNSELINQVFSDRDFWVNPDSYGTFAYVNPVQVFGEYITYGVFLLYCQDHYDQQGLDLARENAITLMNERGFPQMALFSEILFRAREANRDKKIDDWYPDFLQQLQQATH